MPSVNVTKAIAAASDAVRNGTPFSLIRLGDGEAVILGYPEHVSLEHYMRVMRHFFGDYAQDPAQFTGIASNLREAIAEADVVGTRLKPEMELARAREVLLEARAAYAGEKRVITLAALSLLTYITSDLISDTHHVVHKGVHKNLVNSGFLRSLVTRSTGITVITCNEVEALLRSVNPDLTIHHIHVPGEAAREGSRLGEWKTYEPHYPMAFARVRERLRRGGFDGPVLVGAGPLGKIYCNEVKQAGGVALDIGSVFDTWAGRSTRGYHRSEWFAERPLI